jgi:branched-chain amino acid transport system ATP-binding protein
MTSEANTQDAAVPLLHVENLEAWYGESKALHGVSFDVRPGELLTLLGRNGAGKSTTLKSIMGIVRKRRGSIRLSSTELMGRRTYEIARQGIAYCPEERGIFASLSVRENLLLPPILHPGGLSETDIQAAFPNLSRRASSMGMQLSGGEQQMLAIARILRTGARLLLLDEPSEGLAPVIVREIKDLLLKIKAQGFTIVLVEQNLNFARAVADRHVIIENGKVVDTLAAADIDTGMQCIKSYLGV